jgi:hypothetical protein
MLRVEVAEPFTERIKALLCWMTLIDAINVPQFVKAERFEALFRFYQLQLYRIVCLLQFVARNLREILVLFHIRCPRRPHPNRMRECLDISGIPVHVRLFCPCK